MSGRIEDLRRAYHRRICDDVLRQNASGVPNNADGASAASVRIGRGIVDRGDYIVTPDIVVCRKPVADEMINQNDCLLGNDEMVLHTPLRRANAQVDILHASVSCKWTIRSDCSQNARTEGLNLIRNRKGKTPHIVVVVGEPLPGRIASLAYGTGDIDCVYYFALPELTEAAADSDSNSDLLQTLVAGRRLRDISDLPFDLAI